jgi:hypothetical protein
VFPFLKQKNREFRLVYNLVFIQLGTHSFFAEVVVILGFWTQGLTLARQAYYHLSHATFPFLCWVFSRESHKLFFLGWLWTLILLISASQVARISGVSHWHPANYRHFFWLSLFVFVCLCFCFCFVVLCFSETGSHYSSPAHNPPASASLSTGITDVCHHTGFWDTFLYQ